MSSDHYGQVEDALGKLEDALAMRKLMAQVANPQLHLESTKNLILAITKELCTLMRNERDVERYNLSVALMSHLKRMMAIKVDLHAFAEIFQDVDWAAFDTALYVGYKIQLKRHLQT